MDLNPDIADRHDKALQSFAADPPSSTPPRPGRFRAAVAGLRDAGRLARVVVALSVCGTAVYLIQDRIFGQSTREAVLSGAPIVLRAPVEGIFLTKEVPQLGSILTPALGFGIVRNERVDDGRLAQLQAELRSVVAEIAALSSRLRGTEEETQAAREQADAFRAARLDQLQARIAETDAIARAARARVAEAEQIWRRTDRLLVTGAATQAGADVAQRGLSVAREELAQAEQRRSALQAELRAASAGVFSSDGATDRSASQQLLDRVRIARTDLDALREEREAKAVALSVQIATEGARIERLRQAMVEPPRTARLTALLVQPGEFVRQGQDLAHLADCTRPLVTAQVEESVYRGLAIGGAAVFRPARSEAQYQGRIVHLVSPLEEGAARPRGAGRPPARVIVELGGTAEGACEVGRIGELSFS